MSFVDLNAPSAGELLGAAAAVTDGSKGSRNIKRGSGKNGPRTPIEQPAKTRYEMRRNYLNMDRETWRTHWLDIKNVFLPYRTRWLDDGGLPNRGQKKTMYMMDNCPQIALRTMSAGLMAGMTSPSRPWFRLRPELDDTYELPGVAEWCERATDGIHRILGKSNFYRAMPTFYEEIGAFGTAALGIYEVPLDNRKSHQPLITATTYTAGEYWIAQNDQGVVDTFIRKFKWTVHQVIERFVQDPSDENSPGWENIAPSTQALWRARKWDVWIDVVHVIEPNHGYDPGKLGPAGMISKSVYYEMGGNPETLLGEYGYTETPVHVARWATNSDDVYGHSPAMLCLGDAKQLMVQQKRKQQAIDKLVDPPMIGDASLKRTTVSLLPGDVTWLDVTAATSFGVKPLYEVKPDINAMVADISETQTRIRAGMYEDVFQMMRSLGGQLKAGITATEIDARKQEQLLELGPLLDRLTGEVLQPAIDQVFSIAVRRSKLAWQHLAMTNGQVPPGIEMFIPPPPKALQGEKLRIDYISILAQAVRVAEIQGIQQVTQYILQLAQAKPEAMDKFNFDRAIEIMSDRTGVPPECILSEDDVQQIRQQRQQQQQQQQQLQLQLQGVMAASQAAKNLGQAPIGGSNALEQMLGQGTQTQGNA